MKTFKNTEMQRKGHVGRDFIHNLVVSGLVEAVVNPGGQGRSREFDETGYFTILICRELWAFGIKPQAMKPILIAIKNEKEISQLIRDIRTEKNKNGRWFLRIWKVRKIEKGKGYVGFSPGWDPILRVKNAEELGSYVSGGSNLLISLDDLLKDIWE